MEEKQTKRMSSHILELKDLISGPLVATVDADSMSARRYLDYLYEFAFDHYDRATGKVGNMRTLEFTYKSADMDGKHTQRVSIPILTLVPLPLLQVKAADFDFNIQIIDAVSKDRNTSFSLSEKAATDDTATDGVRLRVSVAPNAGDIVASSKSQNSLAANMKVKVRMEQADMPGGLSQLLRLATSSLQMEDVEEQSSTPSVPSSSPQSISEDESE